MIQGALLLSLLPVVFLIYRKFLALACRAGDFRRIPESGHKGELSEVDGGPIGQAAQQ
jgi:hypothetical protein